MNLDKAIDIKTRTGEALLNTHPDEIFEANCISIQAMTFIQQCRVAEPGSVPELLPGETID